MASEPSAAATMVSAVRTFLVVRRADTAALESVVSWAKSIRWRGQIGGIGRAAIGAAILAYLFTFIPVSDVLSAVSATDPGWLAVAVGLLIAERFAGAVRVTVLTRHLRMPLSVLQHCEIAMVSTFYGMFLPGTLAGGAVRWYRMSRPNHMRAEAAAVVTFDRLIGTIMLLSFGSIFWFLEKPPMTSPALQTASLILLVGLVGGLCFSLSRRATSMVLKPMSKAAHRLRLGRVYDGVEKVVVSVQRFRHLPPLALATLVAATATRELVTIGFLAGFAAALGLDVGFMTLGWICAFVNIALLLPVSFSGLGVREGAYVVLLAPYGVSGSSALALAFVMLITHMLVAGGGGLLELKNLLASGLQRRDRSPGRRSRNHLPGHTV